MTVFIAGEFASNEDRELLESMLKNTGTPYHISKYTSNLLLNQAFIKQEVLQTRPTAVVCLGSKALNIFVPNAKDDTLSNLRKQEWEFAEYKVYCTYNPKYINKIGGSRSREYLLWQSDITQAYTSNTENHEEAQFPTLLFQEDQVLEFIKKFANATAYDVEGSSLNPMMEDFRLGGIGLSTPGESGYLLFRDYTNPGGEMSTETRQKLRGLMTFLSRNKALNVKGMCQFLQETKDKSDYPNLIALLSAEKTSSV